MDGQASAGLLPSRLRRFRLISACRGGKPRNDGFGGQSGSGFVAKNRQILTLIRHSGNEANFPE
jgi:hypothetical protein